jgi:hypothetical protein
MYFGFAYYFVRKPHSGSAFHLAPAALAVNAIQVPANMHAPAYSDGFDILDFAKDFKFHYPSPNSAVSTTGVLISLYSISSRASTL